MLMGQEAKLFATLRRWHAVNKCMESFSERERKIITDLFSREKTLAETAKELRLTKEVVRQKRTKILKILKDMLFDSPEEEDVSDATA